VRENNEEIARLQELLSEHEGNFEYIHTQYAPKSGNVRLSTLLETTNRVSEGQAVLNIAERDGAFFVLEVHFSETFATSPGEGVIRRRISV